jgi:hypothetical protein
MRTSALCQRTKQYAHQTGRQHANPINAQKSLLFYRIPPRRLTMPTPDYTMRPSLHHCEWRQYYRWGEKQLQNAKRHVTAFSSSTFVHPPSHFNQIHIYFEQIATNSSLDAHARALSAQIRQLSDIASEHSAPSPTACHRLVQETHTPFLQFPSLLAAQNMILISFSRLHHLACHCIPHVVSYLVRLCYA